MNIAVLSGGLSTERDVSLSTGSMVCNALCEYGHKTALVDAYLGVEDYAGSPIKYFSLKSREVAKIPETAPDLLAIKNRRAKDSKSFFGPGVLQICAAADKVFIALHGENGEDGRVQAALDLMGISYTGTGYFGSALAMDKDLSKKLLQSGGVPTAKWVFVNKDEDAAAATVGLPCVIKPCTGGSSVGVVIAHTNEQIVEALSVALGFGSGAIVEEYVMGREFSVGVLECKALEPIEIVPHEGFYDFKNKYQEGLTDEICPACLTNDEKYEIQRLALKTHEVLRLGSYSRIDFIYDRNRFVCLEANTLPGMTPTSLLPKEAAAQGISYGELCEKIVMAD